MLDALLIVRPSCVFVAMFSLAVGWLSWCGVVVYIVFARRVVQHADGQKYRHERSRCSGCFFKIVAAGTLVVVAAGNALLLALSLRAACQLHLRHHASVCNSRLLHRFRSICESVLGLEGVFEL
jgi:hypothetical protein